MNRGYTRQYDKFRCGPVALANVIKWAGYGFNYRKNHKKLDSMCGTKPGLGTDSKRFNRILRKIAKKAKLNVKEVERPLLKDIERHLKNSGVIVFRYYWSDAKGKVTGHYFLVDNGFEAAMPSHLVKRMNSKGCNFVSGTDFYFSAINAVDNITQMVFSRSNFKKMFLTKYRVHLTAWFIEERSK